MTGSGAARLERLADDLGDDGFAWVVEALARWPVWLAVWSRPAVAP